MSDLIRYAGDLGLDGGRFSDRHQKTRPAPPGSPRTSTPPTSAAYPAPPPSSSTAAGTTAATTSPHSPTLSAPRKPRLQTPEPENHDRPDGAASGCGPGTGTGPPGCRPPSIGSPATGCCWSGACRAPRWAICCLSRSRTSWWPGCCSRPLTRTPCRTIAMSGGGTRPVSLVACGRRQPVVSVPGTAVPGVIGAWVVELTVLAVPDCPNAPALEQRLAGLLAGRPGVRISRHVVGSGEDAARLGTHESPTLLIDGRGPFPAPAGPALACRLYPSDEGRLEGAPAAPRCSRR